MPGMSSTKLRSNQPHVNVYCDLGRLCCLCLQLPICMQLLAGGPAGSGSLA